MQLKLMLIFVFRNTIAAMWWSGIQYN